PKAALVVFCLASLTDLLDGYIARSRGRQTRLGAFLDPVADKLLLTSAFVTLTYLKVIPFWIAVVVVSRDLVLSVGVLVIHVAGGAPRRLPPPPRAAGLRAAAGPRGAHSARPHAAARDATRPVPRSSLMHHLRLAVVRN